MGVLLEPEMGEEKIWFRRVGAENNNGYEKGFRAGSSTVRMGSNQPRSGAGGQRRLFSRLGQGVAPLFA